MECKAIEGGLVCPHCKTVLLTPPHPVTGEIATVCPGISRCMFCHQEFVVTEMIARESNRLTLGHDGGDLSRLRPCTE
jgi:hypothetical protein